MKLKRIVSHATVAALTFVVGIALASLRSSQERVDNPLQSSLPVLRGTSTAHNQMPESKSPPGEIEFPRVWGEVATVVGKLEIVESDFFTWKVSLNSTEILSSEGDGSLPPSVLKHVGHRVPPFDEVIVLRQVGGTCCEFIRFWFLGLKEDGAYFLSDAIGDGFAHAPQVIVGDGYVKVKVRSGYEHNPLDGDGFLPGGTWVLRNGRVHKEK